MKSSNGGIYFKAGIDVEQFKRDIARMRAEVQKMNKTAQEEGSKINQNLNNTVKKDANRIKSEIEGITRKTKKESGEIRQIINNMLKGAAVFFTTQQAIQFAKTIAIVRGEFQQLEVAYSTMLGNKAKADKLMADTIDFAAKTPFDLQGVAGGAKQLLAYGSEAKNITKELTMLGNIAAGLSMPLGDLIYLYGTTRTEGRLFTMDYRQFMGRGIPLADELAKHFKVSKNEIQGLVTAGKVGFPEVQKALQNMTSEGGRFYNLMEEQSKTITGKMSNLGDAISQMYNEIGKSQEGTINAVLDGAGYVVEHYKEIGRVIADLVVIYGSYKAAVITLNAIMVKRRAILVMINQMAKVQMSLNKAITKAEAVRIVQTRLLTKALIKQRVAQIKANLAVMANPYVLAGAAVAGLTYFIYKLITAQSLQEKAQERLNKRIKEQKEQAEAEQNELRELVGIIKDEVSTRTEKQRALDILQQKYPTLFSNMDIEAVKTVNLTEKIKQQKEQQEALNRAKLEDAINDNKKEIEHYRNYAINASSPTVQKGFLKKIEGLEAYNKLLQEQATNYDKLKKKADFEALSPTKKIKKTKEENKLLNQQLIIAEEIAKKQEETTGYSIERYNVEAIEKQILLNKQKIKGWQEEKKEIVSITSLTAELTKKKAELKKLQSVTTWGSREERSEHQKQIETLKGEIDELEKTRKTLTGKDTKEPSKAEKKKFDEVKYKLENKRKLEDLEHQKQQAVIDAMEDGAEKQHEQLKEDAKRKLQLLNRAKEDEVQRIKDAEKQKQEAQGKSYNATQGENQIKKVESVFADIEKEQVNQNKNALKDYYNNLLKEYQTYEEKRTALIKKNKEERKGLVKAGAKEENLKIFDKEANKKVAELDNSYKESGSRIASFFQDASEKSLKELQKLVRDGDSLLSQLANKKDFDPNDNPFNLTEEQYIELKIDPEKLEAFTDRLKSLRSSVQQLENPFKQLGRTIKEALDPKNADKLPQKLAKIRESFGKVQEVAGFVTSVLSDLAEGTGSKALGNIANIINDTVQVAGKALKGAEIGFKLGGKAGAIAGAVIGLASGLIKVIGASKDRAKEREIKALQVRVDALKDSYSLLSKEIEKAYSVNAQKKIREQDENLKRQNELLQRQINAEKRKKRSNKNRIREWENQIKENKHIIEENKDKVVDAIFGESVQQAINNFASAYANAWRGGEDMAKNQKNVVKEMIRNIILQLAKDKIKDKVTALRKYLESAFQDGELDEYEINKALSMGEEINNIQNSVYGKYEKLLKDTKKEDPRKAVEKGFASMTQDQASDLGSRFTLMTELQRQGLEMVKDVNLSMKMLQSNSAKQLRYLAGIETNTARLQKIESDISSMKSGIEHISDNGIKLNR